MPDRKPAGVAVNHIRAEVLELAVAQPLEDLDVRPLEPRDREVLASVLIEIPDAHRERMVGDRIVLPSVEAESERGGPAGQQRDSDARRERPAPSAAYTTPSLHGGDHTPPLVSDQGHG